MDRRALTVVTSLLLIAALPPVLIDAGAASPGPIVTDVRPLVIGETWFTIEWKTSSPARGGVEWGVTTSYGHFANETGNLTLSHTLNVTGLVRDTVYHVRVFAADSAAGTGYSNDFTLGTYPSGRDAPPVSPLVLGAVVASVVLVVGIVLLIQARRKRR